MIIPYGNIRYEYQLIDSTICSKSDPCITHMTTVTAGLDQERTTGHGHMSMQEIFDWKNIVIKNVWPRADKFTKYNSPNTNQ